MSDELTFITVTATCQTGGCGNAGHALAVSVLEGDPDPSVICGPCGQPITDLKPADPETD